MAPTGAVPPPDWDDDEWDELAGDPLVSATRDLAGKLSAGAGRVERDGVSRTARRRDDPLALRAGALLAGMGAVTALVTSRGGAAFGLGDHAQRLLRAASHQLVHAQSRSVRLATLDRLLDVPMAVL